MPNSKGFIENRRVLVTGGAGFIGSNIIDKLLSQNNEVICLDNFSTGKYQNISHLKENSYFTLIEGDIRDLKVCKKACRGVDIVLHQAALGSVPRSINDPLTSNEVNVNGFLNILIAARDSEVKRVVYAASSSTYGDNDSLPKIEERIGNPLSPYAVTKYVNELYAKVFCDLYSMELVGLRYFNVFGPRQDPYGAYAAVIPLFAKALIEYQSPVINGDGSYSRDFTYIKNVIQANERAAVADDIDAINTVYNVACGARVTLNELFSSLRDVLSVYDKQISLVEPNYGEKRVGDIPHSLASIDKANSLLGYKPTYQFYDGIKEAAEWYFNNLRIGN
ncbi:SDR family oxidoreductase [Marinilabiliaceae bacterium ANBcel2]|nr:SDR family oxidoreductase [Marinilabiliaceae bacterium ANBcel2]